LSTDEELRKDVFAWYGSAAYAAQLFEVELVILMLCHEKLIKPDTTNESIDNLDSRLSRKTMGQLLHELKKRFSISPDFEVLLLSYRDKRNYLAHEFFSENGKNLTSVEGCNKMLVELQGIYESLNEADAIVSKMTENIRKAQGIDEEKFMQFIRDEMS